MASSDFKITTEQIQRPDKNSVTVFHLRGWLDAQSESSLVTAAQEAHTQGVRYLILNLEDINTLTSAGIRGLQKVYKLFTDSNPNDKVHLKLCNAPPQVYHVLALTGFLQTMPMYETLKAALTSYES